MATEKTLLLNEEGAAGTDKYAGDGKETVHNTLGTLNGVIVPCLLNIVGAVIFLRLTWAVGSAGVLGVLLMFLIAETQAILTVLSLSAIVSNGEMKGGGAYYVISRSLGTELGSSIGILFFSAYAVGSTYYISSFAEEVVQTWFHDYHGALSPYALRLLIGSLALLLVFTIGEMGASGFTKVNVPLFCVQFASITFAVGCMFFVGNVSELEHGGSHVVWNTRTLADNAWPGYVQSNASAPINPCPAVGECNFQTVFTIVFPAATGIMEGANLSGDLANPAKSIARGTLSAIFISIVVYVVTIIAAAGSFPRHTLIYNPYVMQDIALSDYATIIGVCVSTLSSALGALFGGSRLLQAIARDSVLPFSKQLGYGSRKGDEPRVALFATWLIAQSFLFVGSLDAISPIITAFFCLSYMFCNFCCFALAISGTPNFRPRFKYFSWHTALAGTLLNLIVMFYLNWIYAIVCLLGMVLLTVFFNISISRSERESWGDVRQALIFHQVRKYLLRLDPITTHGKLWRPSILLLRGAGVGVGDGDGSEAARAQSLGNGVHGAIAQFCNYLKKGGVYIVGTTVVGSFGEKLEVRKRLLKRWESEIESLGLKAFPHVTINDSAIGGFRSLILEAGLGAMTPNTVCIAVPSRQRADNDDVAQSSQDGESKAELSEADFPDVVRDVQILGKNIVLLANFDACLVEGFIVADEMRAEAFGHSSRLPPPPGTPVTPTLATKRRDHSQAGDGVVVGGGGGGGGDKDVHIDGSSGTRTPQSRGSNGSGKSRALSTSFPSLVEPRSMEQRLSGRVDVWLPPHLNIDSWESFSGTPLLMIQLAHILARGPDSIRVLRVSNARSAADRATERDLLEDLIKRQSRIRVGRKGSQIYVLSTADDDGGGGGGGGVHDDDIDDGGGGGDAQHSSHDAQLRSAADTASIDYWRAMNRLVRAHTDEATSFAMLPLPPSASSPRTAAELHVPSTLPLLDAVHAFAHGLPPSCFVAIGGDENLMSVSL